jgi:hypothetical protein
MEGAPSAALPRMAPDDDNGTGDAPMQTRIAHALHCSALRRVPRDQAADRHVPAGPFWANKELPPALTNRAVTQQLAGGTGATGRASALGNPQLAH